MRKTRSHLTLCLGCHWGAGRWCFWESKSCWASNSLLLPRGTSNWRSSSYIEWVGLTTSCRRLYSSEVKTTFQDARIVSSYLTMLINGWLWFVSVCERYWRHWRASEMYEHSREKWRSPTLRASKQVYYKKWLVFGYYLHSYLASFRMRTDRPTAIELYKQVSSVVITI